MNQFGSERRMKLALGVDSLDEVAERIRALLDVKSPEGIHGQAEDAADAGRGGEVLPQDGRGERRALQGSDPAGRTSACWIFRCCSAGRWMAGRFITLPCVMTRDPKTGKRNVGMYRMQVYDGQTTGMHWQRQKVAAEHLRERLRAAARRGCCGACELMAETAGGTVCASGTLNAHADGRRMEVAVAIGTDPATTFSAIVPAPPEVEEYLIAGFLRQKPVELVKCETVTWKFRRMRRSFSKAM